MPIDFPGSFVFIFLHREPSWEASLSAIMALWKDLHCISKTYKQQWALKTTCTCISTRLLFKCFFFHRHIYLYKYILCWFEFDFANVKCVVHNTHGVLQSLSGSIEFAFSCQRRKCSINTQLLAQVRPCWQCSDKTSKYRGHKNTFGAKEKTIFLKFVLEIKKKNSQSLEVAQAG